MKINRSHRAILTLLALMVLLFSAAGGALNYAAEAQAGGTIVYGSTVLGIIALDAPMALYFFDATAGDLVHVDAVGLTGGLDPAVELFAPDRQLIISSQRNSFAVDTRDAHVAVSIPQTGVYSLMLSGVNGTTGNFLLELNGRSATGSIPLVFGQATPVTVLPDAPPQVFTFMAETCPTTLTIANQAPGDPFTFPFVVKVRDERAQDVAILRGGEALEDRVIVEPLSGSYEVEVWSDDPMLSGTLSLLVSCAGEAPMCVSGAAGAGDSACPDCPPCPDEDDPLCAAFAVSIDSIEDGTATISWPAVEGANAAIISIHDAAGDLHYARMVVDTLTDTIDLYSFWAVGTPPYTISVTVGAEGMGYSFCAGAVTLDDSDLGPASWGPAAEEIDCEVAIVAPLGTMANGLQTIFWNDVPAAESYWVRVYGQFDVARVEGGIAAPATSLTLDVSEAAIGLGYGGGSDFYIQVDVMRGGESWCSNGTRVTRNP